MGVPAGPNSAPVSITATSPPAQKARPAPVTTIAPTSGFVAKYFSFSIPSNNISSVKAFKLSGRLSVINPTFFLIRVFRTWSVIIDSPHGQTELGWCLVWIPEKENISYNNRKYLYWPPSLFLP